uniref:RNase_PH domain-containing protein n=1 Tax=Rhabditophanes sp. KR3021 TaxID=114890 RepID=A0AC35UI60_9BILA
MDLSEDIKIEFIDNPEVVSQDNVYEMKGMKCQMRYLERSDGSCAYSHGGSTIVCSVNGPGDLNKDFRDEAKMFVDISVATASNKEGKSHLQVQLLPIVSGALLLENKPRSRLAISVLEMEKGGSVYSEALNAICLALLDHGIELKHQFCGVTLVKQKDSDTFIANPTLKQFQEADNVFQLAFKPSIMKGADLIGMECYGQFSFDTFQAAVTEGTATALNIFGFFREIVEKTHTIGV